MLLTFNLRTWACFRAEVIVTGLASCCATVAVQIAATARNLFLNVTSQCTPAC
jgi:hypothetical protein